MSTEPINEEWIRLGARIRASRKAAGYQKAVNFQKALGFVGLPLYYQWEVGKRKPNEDALKKISDLCKVNYNWLATGKGTPFKGIKFSKDKTKEKEALISYEILTRQFTVEQKPTANKIKDAIIAYADKTTKKPHQEREIVYIHIREELMTKILTQLLEEYKKAKKEPQPQQLAKFASQIYADIVSSEPNLQLQHRLVKTVVTTYKRFI